MQWDHEIVIVGGGMVGAALAARLGQAGMSVGLVERASAPTPPSGDYDLRISSLNARSLAFVKASGAVLPGERFMYWIIGAIRACLLGFWLLFIINTLVPFDGYWGLSIMAVGVLIMTLHLAELAVVYQRLVVVGRADRRDVVGVLLFGVLHWLPLLRNRTSKVNDHAEPNDVDKDDAP